MFVGSLLLPILHFFSYMHSKTTNQPSIDNPRLKLCDLHLEPRLAANLLLKELNHRNQHIALCGAFGTGKSSVISAVLLEKKKNANNYKLIRCNIDLWGVDTDSIVAFVLDAITLTLSKYMDVSGFRQLPSHYLEALKASNSSWSFLSSLLNKHESPDNLLKRLDELLYITQKKLVVTIQDIDRNADAEASMSILAGLLERLKQQGSNITYIFAAENTPAFSETIRRICPVRIDLTLPSLTKQISSLQNDLIETLPASYLTCLNYKSTGFSQSDAAMFAELLPSFRAFNSLSKMVMQSWGEPQSKGLRGEVNPHELISMYILKNEYPQIYDLINYADSNGFENSLASLLDNHMPAASEAEKKLVIKVFVSLGFLSNYGLELSQLNEIEDADTGTTKIDIALTNKFSSASNVLSILNADRKRMILRGSLINSDFSHMEAYSLFKDIAKGCIESLDLLMVKVLESKELWLSAIEGYGVRMLLGNAANSELPKKLIYKFLEIPDAELSHLLFRSIFRSIQKSTGLAPYENFISYLLSKRFIDDSLQCEKHFKANSMVDIIYFFVLIQLGVDDRPSKAIDAAKAFVMGFADRSTVQSSAVLITLFAGLKQISLVQTFLQKALTQKNINILTQRLESVDLDSVNLLKTYQRLYLENDLVNQEKLKQDHEQALSGVKLLG
ncbi:hypothetical protein NBRC116595_10230 [Aliiglaciecola sp. NS0011-25]